MTEKLGLRERKKLRTRETVAGVALRMFLESGFDAVSVAEVAEAADVSKMTVFNYFPAKEDLVMHHIADHAGEYARVIAERQAKQAPLDALREHYLAGLAAHDPSTGLSDSENFLAFIKMVFDTPTLMMRVSAQAASQEATLTAAFASALGTADDDIVPYTAAHQTTAVLRALGTRNTQRMLAGERADDVHETAVTETEAAFDLLARGLAHTGLAKRRR
ncbi:TetR family transcriptional regulator [Amycolatopsis minnesotensis]|uniref:TetR family transcriptional regulator n=1 Tax=Amycolatopsis minnesotensis TaxID=337894 RepID=A0ABP5BTT1_9PSEU